MTITIKKLTPALAEDYAHFFDNTPHNNANEGIKCYCPSHCSDQVYQNGGKYWYDTAEERREHALQRVKDGHIQGYFAYADGKIVGWCNANTKADCRECMHYMRTYGGVPVEECRAGEKVKFIFCFAITPNMQKKGIATQLLTYACQDAADHGFDYAEARTHKTFKQDGFRGLLGMYEKCGFVIHAETGDNVVVRKALQ